MPRSICMATYNGCRFLQQQLESIIEQMEPGDEFVIYDDASTDGTPDLLATLEDNRVRLIRGAANVGVNEAFSRAISHASHDLIFMADQDDVWTQGRLDVMTAAFTKERTTVVASNHSLIDEDGQSMPGSLGPNLRAEFDHRGLANALGILRGNRNYFGCAMAFRASLLNVILPFPRNLESHDIWIAIVGLTNGGLTHLPAVTLLHRVHGNNASLIRRPFSQKVRARFLLLSHFMVAWRRGAAHACNVHSDASA